MSLDKAIYIVHNGEAISLMRNLAHEKNKSIQSDR